MEQIFSVFASGSPSNKRLIKWISNRKCVSSLSSRNLLAFSSFSDLSKSDSRFFSNYLYVLDLNLPHEPILITTHNDDITTLQWDNYGSQLMIGDVCGNVEIWGMKDNLVNEWVSNFTFSAFSGESVLAATWFHNGKRTVIVPEKLEAFCSYEDKFASLDFKPSVCQFGGKRAEGCLAVSNSGLVWCVVLLSNGTFVCDTTILGSSRSRIKLVDICKRKNGQIYVLTSNGSTTSSIDSYILTIRPKLIASLSQNKCTLECQPFASFYLESAKTNDMSMSYWCVNQLKYITGEETEGNLSVVVGISSNHSSCIELWQSKEKPLVFHKAFQVKGENESNLQFKRIVWQHVSNANYDQPLAAICTQKFSLFKGPNPPCYLLAAYKNNILKYFSCDHLQLIHQIEVTPPPPKISPANKFNPTLKSSSNFSIFNLMNVEFSWSGCVAVVMDSLSQLFVYRIPQMLDTKNGYSIRFYHTLLEYCVFTVQDCWDILVCIRPNMIENLCDSLTEAFNKCQSEEVQKICVNHYLAVKASLYRLYSGSNATNGQNKSGDCYTLIMLNAIANTIKSLLRPSVNQEKELPAELLRNIIETKGTDPQFFHVNKVLLTLDVKELTKDYSVEPNIILSLQHLNQWIGDVCMFLLASLPQQFHNNYRFPGGGLVFDAKSLNTLRYLLVIIRIWGLMKDSCLPVCTKLTKDVDPVPLLFKLLSKTVASIGCESDESLLDECCSLSNQFLIPSIDLTLKARGVASPILFSNILPLQFQYFTAAPFLKYNVKTHVVDGTVDCKGERRMDTIRYICFGPESKNNESIKLCTRCSGKFLHTTFKSPSTRAWDSKWCEKCICGGHWRLGQ